MKKFLAVLLSVVILIAGIPSVGAVEQGEQVFYNEYTLENGLTVIDVVTISARTRSTNKSAFRERTFYDGDTRIAYIRFEAEFHYDGNTVSVVSKSVTHTNTYEGWNYVQNAFTSYGGTVSLNAKLTKWLILNTSFVMTLSCDKNGNISYT